MFITRDDTIVIGTYMDGRILLWSNGSLNMTTTIYHNHSFAMDVFITHDQEIIFSYASLLATSTIERWIVQNRTFLSSAFTNGRCFRLFVDINDNLYCSLHNLHQVMKKPKNDNSNFSTVVAGNGTAGFSPSMLNFPLGLFVTSNLDMYVADFANNRIQFFQFGQLNATTVVGKGSNRSIALHLPSDITMDADNYFYFVDHGNNRIIRLTPEDEQCIVGCTGSSGAAANQLFRPVALDFDSQGNLFVLDSYNSRIQKFQLISNQCGKWKWDRPPSIVVEQLSYLSYVNVLMFRLLHQSDVHHPRHCESHTSDTDSTRRRFLPQFHTRHCLQCIVPALVPVAHLQLFRQPMFSINQRQFSQHIQRVFPARSDVTSGPVQDRICRHPSVTTVAIDDVYSIDLSAHHTIGHHSESRSPWDIDDHQWNTTGSSFQSRWIFHRSRWRPIQCLGKTRLFSFTLSKWWTDSLSIHRKYARIGTTNTTVDCTVWPISPTISDNCWPSMILGEIHRILLAFAINQVPRSHPHLHRTSITVSIVERESSTMDLRRIDSITKICRDYFVWFICFTQSNVSMDGSHVQQTKQFSASHRLSAGSNRRDATSDHHHRVQEFLVIPSQSIVVLLPLGVSFKRCAFRTWNINSSIRRPKSLCTPSASASVQRSWTSRGTFTKAQRTCPPTQHSGYLSINSRTTTTSGSLVFPSLSFLSMHLPLIQWSRSIHDEFHLDVGSFPLVSTRWFLAIWSGLFVCQRAEWKCPEFSCQSTSIERIVFDFPTQRHDHDTLHRRLSVVGRWRWHQGLFALP